MGLEAFETEGPRTYTKDKNKESTVDQDAIHVLEGIDRSQLNLPDDVTVHEIKLIETVESVKTGVAKEVLVCRDCESVTTSYRAKLKLDQLEHQDVEWYSEFMEHCISRAEEIRNSTTYDEEIEEEYENDHSDEYGSSSSSDSDDSDDLSSGLSNFTS
jgi:transcription elongation factor Elf1